MRHNYLLLNKTVAAVLADGHGQVPLHASAALLELLGQAACLVQF